MDKRGAGCKLEIDCFILGSELKTSTASVSTAHYFARIVTYKQTPWYDEAEHQKEYRCPVTWTLLSAVLREFGHSQLL
jgi:hypothetical protein